MGVINISETQILFGYMHSYVSLYNPKKFIFPSIRQEGGGGQFKYPGADVVISNNHLIQFKRPSYFKTNGIREFKFFKKPHDINPEYFRFNIKNDSPSNQLSKLIEATKNGLYAEYVSPLFNDDTIFHNIRTNHKHHLDSYAHIDISQFKSLEKVIGKSNDHSIIYTSDSIKNGYCYCFSEPKKISGYKFDDELTKHINKEKLTIKNTFETLNNIFYSGEFPVSNIVGKINVRYFQLRLLTEFNILWVFKI
ncbi:MAG: hypothetical protein IPK08_06255 [Bacteroidetes bacterium]|nr:hypothetical protein [Bacteroidota bacterium]